MEIVGAFACSHAGLILGRRDQAPAEQRDRVFGAYRAVQEEIGRLRPDAVVVVATDHLQAFPLSGVPAFSVGVGPVATGLGDGGLPPCIVPVHQKLAQAILAGGMARGVDLAFSEKVAIDHSFVMPLSLLVPSLDIPIVPVVQNCNVPPRPAFQRSRALGRAMRDAIHEGPAGRAVVIGTGGLSHWVGSPSRRAFMNRPAGTRLPELAQHPVVLDETVTSTRGSTGVPRRGRRRAARGVCRGVDSRARGGGRRQRRPGAPELVHDGGGRGRRAGDGARLRAGRGVAHRHRRRALRAVGISERRRA
jgi:hypothetical protein